MLAKKLGYTYIDTGAMYRSVTLKVLQASLLERLHHSPDEIYPVLENLDISFQDDRVFLDGEDVSASIRENSISRHVSFVSSLEPVRNRLKQIQRKMGEQRGVVMDGRDIGTVIFPDAELKIFLIAEASERAQRRHAELVQKKGNSSSIPTIAELEQEILQRDRDDAIRQHAPLRKHEDAVEIDTSKRTIDEQVELVYTLAKEKTVQPQEQK